MTALIVYGVLGLFCLLGLVVFCYGVRLKIRETESRYYVSTEGTVFESKDRSYTEGEGTHTSQYQSKIEYYVDSRRYVRSRSLLSSKEIPVGTKFDILYNPQNPQDCVIKGQREGVAAIIAGALFVILTAAGMLIFIKMLRFL